MGSARHDYTQSEWYVEAKKYGDKFWSDPYYYYDGTDISGRYCTFVKPIYNKQNDLSQGLGLGLPLAKRHAFILGGDLVIDKIYHQGCRITLEMPK